MSNDAKAYFDILSPTFIDWQFYANYIEQEPPFGELGAIVFIRTYSRFIEELGRREYWRETVLRVVEYSLSLDKKTAFNLQISEAEELFDLIFNLRGFPSGRTLWIGGTKTTEINGSANYNCFQRNTRFLTDKGYFSFDDFNDGDVVNVLSRGTTGTTSWKSATVRNFGQAELYKLTVIRSQETREIYTTANHRWYVRGSDRNVEKITATLKPGDKLPKLVKVNSVVDPCPVARQHGIVFGDGTLAKSYKYSCIALQQHKTELVSYFNCGTVLNQGTKGGLVNEDVVNIINLPYFFKDLPNLESANRAYLLGFIQGWFAADGSISSGSPTMSSSIESSLYWLKDALALIGMYSSKIKVQRTQNPYNLEEYKPLYTMTIYKESIPDDFFILEKHKEGFYTNPEKNSLPWKIVSVEKTNIVEDVWCVEEPVNETFTLEGGILTRNCSAAVINSTSKFAECFYMLMVGAGFGFSVEEKYISQLPEFYPGKVLINKDYNYNKDTKVDDTEIEFYSGNKFIASEVYTESKLYIDSDSSYLNLPPTSLAIIDSANIIVGDSREGWVNALRLVITLLTRAEIKTISVDYDYVRPEGSPLKTFGGRSSGHSALESLINQVITIVNELKQSGKLNSVQCLDILNSIGIAVVVGGVRRSSELALGDLNDTSFVTAKKDLWSNDSLSDKRTIRVMSNNSVTLYENPGLDYFKYLMESVRTSGEPGIYSIGNAQKRDVNRKLTNPCGEILLDDRGVCNLTEANVVAHINREGGFNWESWYSTLTLITRMGSRITLVDMWHPEWQATQQRDRLLGVSMTGVVEAFDMLQWDQDEIDLFYRYSQNLVNDVADRYHEALEIPYSLLKTTIKPSGTLSQLPTVSSGIHRPYAPYYLRRIRISKQDPLAKTLHSLGLEPVPENSQGDDLFAEKCNTWVFTFPVKTAAKTLSIDEPALVQLERYKACMQYYVQHNVSITVSVAEHEWDLVANWLYENYEYVIGISFLPRFNPLDDDGKVLYPNLPYQTSNQLEYETTKANIPVLTESKLLTLLQNFEERYEETDLGSDCTGSCPVR